MSKARLENLASSSDPFLEALAEIFLLASLPMIVVVFESRDRKL